MQRLWYMASRASRVINLYLAFGAVVVRAPYVVVLGGLDDSKGLGGGHGTPWWHRGGLAAAGTASGETTEAERGR